MFIIYLMTGELSTPPFVLICLIRSIGDPGAGSVSARPWVMDNGRCISEEKVCFCRKSQMSALRLAKTTILQGGWQSGWRELKHVLKWFRWSSSHQRWNVISVKDVCCFYDKVVWLCLLNFVHLACKLSIIPNSSKTKLAVIAFRSRPNFISGEAGFACSPWGVSTRDQICFRRPYRAPPSPARQQNHICWRHIWFARGFLHRIPFLAQPDPLSVLGRSSCECARLPLQESKVWCVA